MKNRYKTFTQCQYFLGFALLAASSITLPCQAQDADPPKPEAPNKEVGPDEGKVNAELIIVEGTPGEEGYAEDFKATVELWKDAGKRGLAKVTVVGADVEQQREKLKETIAELQPDSSVPVWIVLVGHGTFNRRAANFNLTGEDVSALDFGEWLEEFERPIILIHGGAASAPYVRRLSREGRVIITATRTGTEVNYTRFGTYMARALQSEEADLNNDGQASVYECFLHATRQTNAFYETNGLLATEHALIDDNGDGRGSGLELLERFELGTSRLVDGDYARMWSLVLNEDEMKLSPDQRRRRNALEREVLELRRKRSDYADESAFYAVAEPILLQIAEIYAENKDTSEEDAKDEERDVEAEIDVAEGEAPAPVDGENESVEIEVEAPDASLQPEPGEADEPQEPTGDEQPDLSDS